MYIATYHEEGKEPQHFFVSDKEYKPEDRNLLFNILKQAKKHGFWTQDPNVEEKGQANGKV